MCLLCACAVEGKVPLQQLILAQANQQSKIAHHELYLIGSILYLISLDCCSMAVLHFFKGACQHDI